MVVECPWGVLRLAQLGIPAVALLGTQLSQAQQGLLSERGVVVLMLDGDEAGRRASAKLKAILSPHTKVRRLLLANGCDPDDLSDDQLRRVQQHLLP